MLYTVDDVAKIVKMHPRTIRRYIEKGQIRAERIGGSWRISEEALSGMFDAPGLKETIAKNITDYSEDMLDLYLKGKHRLQKNNLVMMSVFVFNSQEETWVLPKMSELMTAINKAGQDGPFDFTMTGSEQGMYRLTFIAPLLVLQVIAAEMERIRLSSN